MRSEFYPPDSFNQDIRCHNSIWKSLDFYICAFASGYWEQPEATALSWRNLWLHTGDRVVREPDGWYRFVDRIKDVIRRRGENISSAEVEQVVAGHPGVASVAAFAVPAELAEDEVMIAVVPRTGHLLDPARLLDHCARDLPYFAVPRYVDMVTELPVTATGKVAKAELRSRGVTVTTWDSLASGPAR